MLCRGSNNSVKVIVPGPIVKESDPISRLGTDDDALDHISGLGTQMMKRSGAILRLGTQIIKRSDPIIGTCDSGGEAENTISGLGTQIVKQSEPVLGLSIP